MKKVTLFIRFVLVMVGSFFLAIGILIANGCKKLNGRSRNGPRLAKSRPATRAASVPVSLARRSADELIKILDSPKYKEREAAEDALIARGQEVVPKLTSALKSDSLEVTARVTRILSVLGWYVTRAGKVEKMSESKEFQEMMRKRLPEMPAE